jgi:hypothetical protein
LYLEKLGYGKLVNELDGRSLADFLARVPDCTKALQGYSQDGNSQLLGALDQLLEQAHEKKEGFDPGSVDE